MTCAAIVLAALLAPRQLGVDEEYVPRIGDEAIIGCYIKAELKPPGLGNNGRVSVGAADCFSSIANARKAMESLNSTELLDPCPESYRPRAGTRAKVLDIYPLRIRMGDEDLPLRVLRIKVLEGEFKDKTLYVESANVLRLSGHPAKKPASRDKLARDRPATPSGDLALTDLVVGRVFGDAFKISGRFRNTSPGSLKSLQVVISFEDAQGRLISSHTALCQPDTIDLGGNGDFQGLAQLESSFHHVKLEFRTYDKSIPWVDRSGKNAHP